MRLTLTRQAEYALRALIWLAGEAEVEAERGDGRLTRHKAASIARATNIPPVFAARVLAQLQHQELLFARAGQHGGYALARPAGRISLLQVIEAVEGPLRTRDCVLRDSACGEGGTCTLHEAWSAAQDALRSVLGGTTLASLPVMSRQSRPTDAILQTDTDLETDRELQTTSTHFQVTEGVTTNDRSSRTTTHD